MKKYSEINVGDKETLSHTITKSDIEKFVQLTGDDNRLHVDEKFASTTQFKKPVVHGMLGASFISTIIGTKFQLGLGAVLHVSCLCVQGDDALIIILTGITGSDQDIESVS